MAVFNYYTFVCDQVVGFPEISFLVSKLISAECCDVFVWNFFNELICSNCSVYEVQQGSL